jgi:hypothetical protein
MKKICMKILTIPIMLSLVLLGMINVNICSADPSDEISITLDHFGPVWDINHDGIIDVLDASLLSGAYGSSGEPGWKREDIDKDGYVGVKDVSLLVNNYGKTWLVP